MVSITRIEHRPTERKTKILATIGPASRSPERIRELLLAGANAFRLNFSHGTHAEHLEVFNTIRAVSSEMNIHAAVLQDLAGPKIRISAVNGDFVTLIDNQSIRLRPSEGGLSDTSCIFVEAVNPAKALSPGQRVLLVDGLIELRAEKVSSDEVACSIVKGGRIRSRTGIAFPDSQINLPATTDKDMNDLLWGIQNGVDYVAISFVQNAEDLLRLRKVLKERNSELRIVAKIERKSALGNLYEIMDAADGVMVARGDLGIELPLERLPMLQKQLIEQSNYRGLPVIVATQMLHSMVTSVRPTRAEVSDIAAAVMGGTDALMLSEETAIGEHPVEAVKYLGRIAHEAEKSFTFSEFKLRLRDADRATVPDAVAYAACAAGVKVNASAIVACTETGNSARLVAKYRPQQPLYATSSSEGTLRRMSLYWGVTPLSCASSSTHHDEVETALRAVQESEDLPNGSKAVITGGLAVRTPGSTSVLEIRELHYR